MVGTQETMGINSNKSYGLFIRKAFFHREKLLEVNGPDILYSPFLLCNVAVELNFFQKQFFSILSLLNRKL